MTSPACARPILLTLDGSPDAIVAVPVAQELARVLSAPPHILYVASGAVSPGELPAHVGMNKDQLRPFVLHQAEGDPVARILELASSIDASFVIMSTGSTEWALGPTAERVASAAPCPVVLVRPARGLAPWHLEEILLPYDGTPSTAAALRPAAALCKCARARLFAVYVAQTGEGGPEERGSLAVPRYIDQPQHEWPAWVGEFLERLTSVSDIDPAHLRLFVARGRAGPEIVRLADEHGIDLIVLAWKGLLDPERARTAKDILRAAPCPILVLRTET